MLRARTGIAFVPAALLLALAGALAAASATAAELSGRVILAKSAGGKPSREVAAAQVYSGVVRVFCNVHHSMVPRHTNKIGKPYARRRSGRSYN